MVGAPKARKCTSCGPDRCVECGLSNRRYVVDLSAYSLYDVVTGDAFDAPTLDLLASDPLELVRRTSVRTDAELTPGFAPYVGCPQES